MKRLLLVLLFLLSGCATEKFSTEPDVTIQTLLIGRLQLEATNYKDKFGVDVDHKSNILHLKNISTGALIDLKADNDGYLSLPYEPGDYIILELRKAFTTPLEYRPGIGTSINKTIQIKPDKVNNIGLITWTSDAKVIEDNVRYNFDYKDVRKWFKNKYSGSKWNKKEWVNVALVHGGTCIEGNCINGPGTMTWADGGKYVGEWKNYRWHGQGTMTWAHGDKYIGPFKNDKRHGQGTYTWTGGGKYVGQWKNDTRHGQGTYTWPDGRKYVGEWKNYKREGQGTMTWSDGRKYVGEWKNYKREGQGTMTWPDGRKYVGEWKDDKRHGQGTYTNADGYTKDGTWQAGDLVE